MDEGRRERDQISADHRHLAHPDAPNPSQPGVGRSMSCARGACGARTSGAPVAPYRIQTGDEQVPACSR